MPKPLGDRVDLDLHLENDLQPPVGDGVIHRNRRLNPVRQKPLQRFHASQQRVHTFGQPVLEMDVLGRHAVETRKPIQQSGAGPGVSTEAHQLDVSPAVFLKAPRAPFQCLAQLPVTGGGMPEGRKRRLHDVVLQPVDRRVQRFFDLRYLAEFLTYLAGLGVRNKTDDDAEHQQDPDPQSQFSPDGDHGPSPSSSRGPLFQFLPFQRYQVADGFALAVGDHPQSHRTFGKFNRLAYTGSRGDPASYHQSYRIYRGQTAPFPFPASSGRP